MRAGRRSTARAWPPPFPAGEVTGEAIAVLESLFWGPGKPGAHMAASAERLLETDSHVRRQRGVAVQQFGEGLAPG